MTAVLVFAKAPRPGSVKTRLAAAVGAARAVGLYRTVGRRVVEGVSRRYPVTVWFDPPDAADEMRAWLGARAYRPQASGDLGRRLEGAFAWHWARGDRPVIAIGTDAPQVNADTIAAATTALERADVVLGPAVDGGYYLLGLREAAPPLFRDIPWSSARVTAVTLERAAGLGLRIVQLDPLRDLDTVEDLIALGLGDA